MKLGKPQANLGKPGSTRSTLVATTNENTRNASHFCSRIPFDLARLLFFCASFLLFFFLVPSSSRVPFCNFSFVFVGPFLWFFILFFSFRFFFSLFRLAKKNKTKQNKQTRRFQNVRVSGSVRRLEIFGVFYGSSFFIHFRRRASRRSRPISVHADAFEIAFPWQLFWWYQIELLLIFRVALIFDRAFLSFLRFLGYFTRSSSVLLDFKLFLPIFSEFSLVGQGFTGFYLVLLGFT